MPQQLLSVGFVNFGRLSVSFVLIFFSICGAGCNDSELPDSSELGKLKILTIKSSNGAGEAEFAPGDGPITLAPIVSYLNAASGVTLSYDIVGCVDPGIFVGAEPSCAGQPTETAIANGAISTLNAANSFTGEADTAPLTLPGSAIIFANRSPIEKYNGVAYLITYKVTASDGSRAQAIKRLVVSSRPSKNKNPVLDDVLSNGVTMTSYPGGTTINLASKIGIPGAEGYQQMKDDGSLIDRRESLITSWFVSDGELQYLRTTNELSTALEIPSGLPTSRAKVVIAVVRDERGGIDFQIKSFP